MYASSLGGNLAKYARCMPNRYFKSMKKREFGQLQSIRNVVFTMP